MVFRRAEILVWVVTGECGIEDTYEGAVLQVSYISDLHLKPSTTLDLWMP